MEQESEYEYDIALSFAGEDRVVAEQLAQVLNNDGIRVFYDRNEEAALWGKDLYQHLQTIYRDKAKYCIIFVSDAYSRKLWTRHELRQAQARAFRENQEYILPVRLDDSEIPGLNATVGYIDLRTHNIESLRKLVLNKLFGSELDFIQNLIVTVRNIVHLCSVPRVRSCVFACWSYRETLGNSPAATSVDARHPRHRRKWASA